MTQLTENKPRRRAMIATLSHFDDPTRVVVLPNRGLPGRRQVEPGGPVQRESKDLPYPSHRYLVGRCFSSDITGLAHIAYLSAGSHAEGLAELRRAACTRSGARPSRLTIPNRNIRRLETHLTRAKSTRASFLIATNDDIVKVVVLPNRGRPSPRQAGLLGRRQGEPGRSGELGGSVQRERKDLFFRYKLIGGLGAGGLDGFETFAGGFDGALDVRFGVRGGNEERLELRRREQNAAPQHLGKEGAESRGIGFLCITVVEDGPGSEEQRQQRACDADVSRGSRLLQRIAEPFAKASRFAAELIIKIRSFQFRQRGEAGAHRQRIPRKRAGLIDGPERRDHFHDVPAPAVGRHGQPAADNFPQRGEIRADAVEFLCTAVTDAKAGDHFVENQQRAIALGDFAQAFEKAERGRRNAHVRGHRFDNHRRDFSRVLLEDFLDGVGVVIRRVQRQFRQRFGHARARRDAECREARAGFDQKAVGMPVVTAFEFQQQVTLGEPARRAHRAHGGFGAGADKSDALDRGQRANDLLAELGFERRRHSIAGPLPGLVGNRRDDVRMRVAQDQSAPGANVVDVLAAIDIVEPRARGMVDDQRRSAYGAKRANRAVHPADESFFAAFKDLRGAWTGIARGGSRHNSAGLQPARHVFRVVAENDFGAGALDAGENFEDHALLVDPAVARRGFHHGVFAANVVGGHGNVESIAHALNDVEVRQRGFHHDYVAAFFQIERHFAQRLARVSRIHLIAAAVAELRSGLRGFAERAVEARAILRGIRQDRDIFEAILVELRANRAHAAVHHVGRRDHVGARARVRKSGVGKTREARVVQNLSIFHHAAVPVARVFAKAHVGDDQQIELRFFYRFNRSLDRALRVGCAGTQFVFFLGQAEEYYSGNSE